MAYYFYSAIGYQRTNIGPDHPVWTAYGQTLVDPEAGIDILTSVMEGVKASNVELNWHDYVHVVAFNRI